MSVQGRSIYKYQVALENGRQTWLADEPISAGGSDIAPTPVDMLLGAVASCKVITAQMYAARKEWPLEWVTIALAHEQERGSNGIVTTISSEMTFGGALNDEQKARLLQIADKCPVHKILTNEVVVTSTLAE